MALITIKTWADGRTLFEVEADTLKGALERAVAAGTNLRGADLHGADLEGANLISANMTGTNLIRANLRGAHLDGASLAMASLDGANLRGAHLAMADLAMASLDGANLRGANLRGADLDGADLDGAHLAGNTILDTGEKWEEYLAEVVPALLTAGGKTIEQVLASGCWKCHKWANCPMHVALGVEREQDALLLLRPRVRQFVRFFDAGLIPVPELSE